VPIPPQRTLLLPLLEALKEHGGRATSGDTAKTLARTLQLDEKDLAARAGQRNEINRWARTVRWIAQRAKGAGYLESEAPGLWALSQAGESALRNATPGLVVRVYETERGVALWGEVESAIGVLEPESVQLLFSSPPYPLVAQKTYGNLDEREHVDWLVGVIDRAKALMKKDGSIVLNVGDTWRRGSPTLSTYPQRLLLTLIDELGLHLAQAFTWHNPSRLPSPAQWVTIERVRVTHATEHLYWLGLNDRPKANNRNVLKPYSAAMRARLRAGGERSSAQRPSGHTLKAGAFSRDNGGAIPHNLLRLPNTRSNDAYASACREHGLPIHPARMPRELAEFFIRLTTDPGDTVLDPFCGSNTTGAAAEALGRHHISVDRSLTYVLGSSVRFPTATPSL
jgi:DNA modification methylase